MAGRPDQIPARKVRRTSAFPLFPMLAALLVVVLALQGGRMLMELNTVTPATTPKLASAPSVFDNVGRIHPKSARSVVNLQPQRAIVAPFGANIRVGRVDAPHVLTIFTDPLCTSCRITLLQTLRGVDMEKVQLVYKYWPMDAAKVDGGLIFQVAHQQGKGVELLKMLEVRESPVTEVELLSMLDVAGVDLSTQRKFLEDNAEILTAQIGRDMAQARELNFGPPPQFVLDDYYLDGRILYKERIGLYVERLGKGQSLIQAKDYWLGGGA